jgi:hypothetical protein
MEKKRGIFILATKLLNIERLTDNKESRSKADSVTEMIRSNHAGKVHLQGRNVNGRARLKLKRTFGGHVLRMGTDGADSE